jgi:hypothetical protein
MSMKVWTDYGCQGRTNETLLGEIRLQCHSARERTRASGPKCLATRPNVRRDTVGISGQLKTIRPLPWRQSTYPKRHVQKTSGIRVLKLLKFHFKAMRLGAVYDVLLGYDAG